MEQIERPEQTERTEVLRSLFQEGEKYTLFEIDSVMAMTHKREIAVVMILPDKMIYRPKGKRKDFQLKFEKRDYTTGPLRVYEGAIFKGWNQPFTCDTDQEYTPDESGAVLSKVMRGNACYNFMGEPEELRGWIDANQLNPFFEKVRVVSVVRSEERVVYPELFKGGHAVIERMLAKELIPA
jgi:hypothetical protein